MHTGFSPMIHKPFMSILTFLGVKAGGAQGQAGTHLRVVVEAPLARCALPWAPANTALTALVAPPAPPRCLVAKEPCWAGADTHPGGGTEGLSLKTSLSLFCPSTAIHILGLPSPMPITAKLNFRSQLAPQPCILWSSPTKPTNMTYPSGSISPMPPYPRAGIPMLPASVFSPLHFLPHSSTPQPLTCQFSRCPDYSGCSSGTDRRWGHRSPGHHTRGGRDLVGDGSSAGSSGTRTESKSPPGAAEMLPTQTVSITRDRQTEGRGHISLFALGGGEQKIFVFLSPRRLHHQFVVGAPACCFSTF